MADSAAFNAACDTIERDSILDRLEARGTVRIVLKEAGLDAKTVTAAQLRIVAERTLAGELERRGVTEAAAVCEAVAGSLAALPDEQAGTSPEAVFARLGGRS